MAGQGRGGVPGISGEPVGWISEAHPPFSPRSGRVRAAFGPRSARVRPAFGPRSGGGGGCGGGGVWWMRGCGIVELWWMRGLSTLRCRYRRVRRVPMGGWVDGGCADAGLWNYGGCVAYPRCRYRRVRRVPMGGWVDGRTVDARMRDCGIMVDARLIHPTVPVPARPPCSDGWMGGRWMRGRGIVELRWMRGLSTLRCRYRYTHPVREVCLL
uniref:Uncharacterized protein n=1 Tax=Candidatus Kentrum sp. DK TaxID=2126562 RepID=A0A450TBU2_9GAMM|nr:MAG: hypothetical protein BECKDK2373C_GA0170839_11153 [Candidatus Kentron sp. DK]